MELFTVNELAELLKVSRNRIVLMARRGEIPAITIGGKLRFDPEETEKWLKANAISIDDLG